MSTPSAGSGRVTIARIAAEAGVSSPTVSKVINGRREVAAATRERVEAAIAKHGYQRRRAASSEPAALIDVVFNHLVTPWAMELIRGVVQEAAAAGRSVVVTECPEGRTPSGDWLAGLIARPSAGVILVISDLDERQRAKLAARRVPYVVVDPAGEPPPEVASVGATNWAGGLAATSHLVELGHTDIGMIGGPPQLLCSRARVDGYRTALERAGIAVDPELIRWSDFTVESGFAEASALLDRTPGPTAIFAGSDLVAFGAYQAARSHGLIVGRDVSVVGFDDLPMARWMTPPLTTVRQPLREMAATATRLVLGGRLTPADPVAAGEAAGNWAESRRIELSTSLIRRDSTAAPR